MALKLVEQLYEKGLDVSGAAKESGMTKTEIRQITVEILIKMGASKGRAKHFAEYGNPVQAYKRYLVDVELLIQAGASKGDAKYFARFKDPVQAYQKYLTNVELLKQMGASKGDAKYFASLKTPVQAYQKYLTNVESLIQMGASEGWAKYFAKVFKTPVQAYQKYETRREFNEILAYKRSEFFYDKRRNSFEQLIQMGASEGQAKYFTRFQNPIETYKRYPTNVKKLQKLGASKNEANNFAFKENPVQAYKEHLSSDPAVQEIEKTYGKRTFNEILREVAHIRKSVNKYGKNRILTLATYAVLKKQGEPITLSEITLLFSEKEIYVSRLYKRVYGDSISPIDVEEFITKGVKCLGLNKNTEERAIGLYNGMKPLLQGKSPEVRAAFVLKEVTGLPDNKIAEAFTIVPPSIAVVRRQLKQRESQHQKKK